MYFRLLFVIACLLTKTVNTQPLYFKHLTVNDGLSQAVNNCVFRDSKGFIWISSFDGLNRYDGISCRVFRTGQPGSNGLKGTLFLNILEDSSGNIWIGSNNGLNMYHWRENRFYNYALANRTEEQFYSPFYIDAEQTIWVQSGHEIFRFTPATNKFEKVAAPFTSGGLLVRAISTRHASHSTILYAVHQNKNIVYRGLWQNRSVSWDSTQLKQIQSAVTTLYPEDDNHVWIGSQNGLYSWSTGLLQSIQSVKDYHITALQKDRNNKLWIGTHHHGLMALDISTHQLVQQQQYSLFDNHSLSGNQVWALCTDSMQNLWVSVWGKGVDYTNLARFRFHHFITREEADKHHTDNFIKSIIQVGSDTWCGTQAGGIIILDGNQQITTTIQKDIPVSSEYLMAWNNQVWLASNNGMFVISAKSHSAKRITPAGLQYNFISAVNNRELLLSSNSGLFLCQVQTQQVRPIKTAKEVYLASFKTKQGKLFIGRPFKGFMIGHLLHDSLVVEKNIPMEATVKCFYESNDSTIWLGTTQGLVEFNSITQQVKKIYTTADGLSNQYVYGIIPHGNEIWLSTNAGINCFHTINHRVKTYTVNDGLQSNEFNTYAFGKTNHGVIQFAGINGLNAFNPATIQQYDNPPQLQLTNIQLNDNEQLAGINPAALQKLLLDYKKNTISLQFTVLHYDEPLANSIYYRLDGYDKNWISTGNKSDIRYSKLPAGNYTLFVKAFNASGQSSNLYQLPITILTPWWLSWWFRFVTAVLCIGLIILFIKIHTRQKLNRQRQRLEKELAVEQERTRVARDLHDGLGGMLSGIKHAVAALQRQSEHDYMHPALLTKTLGMLDESILELRRVAYSMTPPSLTHFGLDHALRDFCSSVSGAEGLDLHYQSIGMDQLHPNEIKSLAIYRIIQELVNNIIKHAKATEALVQLTANGKKLSITVEDNGVGFDKKLLEKSKGLGWRNIRSRVESLPGMIDLQSLTGKGSSVYIEVAEINTK